MDKVSKLEGNALSIISGLCEVGKVPTRANILAYEEMAKTLPQIEIPVKHHIHGGMYGREITIPKGSLITGQIYKFDHFDVMISGDITVSTETGERKRITGYNCFKGESGKKRAGYAHEDTTWITFHPFGEQVSEDGEEIQKFITAESFADLDEFNRLVNINDYNQMVESMSMSESEIRKQVENQLDMCDLPAGNEHIYTKESVIEGLGLFSKINIDKDAVICPSRVGELRTIAGRFTNHAMNPNAKMIIRNGHVDLVSNRKIEAGEEITVNYRNVITHRAIEGDLCQE